MANFKTMIRTLMFVFVVLFCATTFYYYTEQGNARAESNIPKLPDFEHTNNQQFIDNVVQCVNYIEHNTTDVYPVNLELLLAQAALESGWGTSRFYKQANNIFGVWSYSENEPRIKASEARDGKPIFVKKYDTLPESFASYFKTLARGPYKTFRSKRTQTNDVFQLITHLQLYSELREEYVSRLESLIRFNNLEQYDSYTLKVNTNE